MAKPKRKTDPRSVRFKETHFDFFVEETGISSPQEIVDYLLDRFCSDNGFYKKKESRAEVKEVPVLPSDMLTPEQAEKLIEEVSNRPLPKERDTKMGRLSFFKEKEDEIRKIKNRTIKPA